MDQILKFKCAKCGNNQYEIGEIWAVGTILTRIFGFHNKRFTYISCQRCHFTEYFKVPQKKLGEVYNFIVR